MLTPLPTTEPPAGITTNSPPNGPPQPSSSSSSSSSRVPRVFFPPLPPSSNNQQAVSSSAIVAEETHASGLVTALHVEAGSSKEAGRNDACDDSEFPPLEVSAEAVASSAQEATTSTPAPPDPDVEEAVSGEAAKGAGDSPLVVMGGLALPFAAAAAVQASSSIVEPLSTSKVEDEEVEEGEEAWNEESARGWMWGVLSNASSSGGRCHSFESPHLLDDLRDGTALCDLLNVLLEVCS